MRSSKRLVCAALLLTAVGAHAGETIPPAENGRTWARHLAERVLQHDPTIAGIDIVLDRDGKAGDLAGAASRAGPAQAVRDVPLANMSGVPVGRIKVRFRTARAADTRAKAIASAIGRDVMNAKHLVDPWPFDRAYATATEAQRLVDLTRAAHPELLVLAIHADEPGTSRNVIIGSTIGRIGKLADDDDRRVIDTGVTNREVVGDGARYALELPLLDARGQRIGALGEMFALQPGSDRREIEARAIAIRDSLARRIPDAATLFAAPRSRG